MSDNYEINDTNQDNNASQMKESNERAEQSIYAAGYVSESPKKEPLVGIPEVDRFAYSEPKNAIHRFRERHALACAIIVLAITVIVMLISQVVLGNVINLVLNSMDKSEMTLTENLMVTALSEIVPLTLGLILINVLGLTNIFKVHKKNFGAALVPAIYLLIAPIFSAFVQCIQLTMGGKYEWGKPVNFIVCLGLCVLVGFSEEILFRGIIGEIIYRKYANSGLGIWFATIMTAVMFSAIHLVNIGSGNSPMAVIVQVIGVLAEGLLISAVYFRSRNIYAIAFIHGFFDFCSFLPTIIVNTNGNVITNTINGYSPMMLVGMLPYIGIACLILRNAKLREMLGRTDIRADKATKNRFRIAVIIVGAVLIVSMFWGMFEYVKYIYGIVVNSSSEIMNGIAGL